ncbi:ABC-type multidrug transport system%2C ATPase component [Mycobacterium tuberculosis]|nr:ABC-type multidrug transport system%2C ATPase component [Mycobacterium tuberculosis]
MTPAIEINDLKKSFGKVKALDGLDLRVETGHVHGFLGPNGAGKSTTIRILLGVLRVLSSHILAQVEALADRVSIIRDGRIVETGTLTELRHLTRTTVAATTGRDASAVADLPGVHDLRTENGQLRFDVDGDHLAAAVRRLGELDVQALTAHPPTLEQLLLRHYGDELARTGNGTTGGSAS